MQHLWSKEPSQQPSTFLGTSFSRQRQSWESVLLKGQKWFVYQGELSTILGPYGILVKHRTSLWEFKCEMCGNWIRIKRKITKHMICKHFVSHLPAKQHCTATKLSGLDMQINFAISARLSVAGREVHGTTGKRPFESIFLRKEQNM